MAPPPAAAAPVAPPPPAAPGAAGAPKAAGSPAAGRKPETQPPAEPKPQDSTLGIVVVAVVLVLMLAVAAMIGVYLLSQPSKEDDACTQATNQAAALLASGDATGARGQLVLAMTSCSGEARVKAGELQAATEKAIAAQAKCERSFRRIRSLIAERRLQSALGTLDTLDTACADSPEGKALRSQIETGQRAANAAETEMRKQVAEGDLKAASASLEQVGANNREHPDLAALRQELAAGVKAREAPATVNTPPVTAPLTAPVAAPNAAAPREVRRDVQVDPPQAAQPARPAPPAAVAPAPTANPQAEMAQSFLRDAEAALNQLKFDAAKTYVESARRMDPANPQAAALARRIKERELQYLKEETSIK